MLLLPVTVKLPVDECTYIIGAFITVNRKTGIALQTSAIHNVGG
jgi:hypothetical protein